MVKDDPITIRLNRSHLVVDDMPEEMRNEAIYFAFKALENFKLEQNMANYVKGKMDELFGQQFQVIVGRSFGSKITHEFNICLLLELHGLFFLIFRAG